MQKTRRLSQFVRGKRHTAFSRGVGEFQKGLPGEIRAVPGELVQRIRPELGRLAEKHRSRARAAKGLRHASHDREGNGGRNINGEQTVRKGKQPASQSVRTSSTNELHILIATTSMTTHLDANNL